MTATALIALALAIGANTAMFTVVDAVLLRPLPFEDPDRLVMVWEDSSHVGFPRNTPAPANWVDWRKQNTVFTDIAASRGASYNLTGDGAPERVIGSRFSGNFWQIVGAKPLIGRTYTVEEDQSAARVAVISYTLWQRRYGGDGKVIGRKVLLSDEPFTVIGVMRPEFSFPNRRTEIWTPVAFTPADLAQRSSHFLMCVARLKPGVTVEQASAEMRVIAQRLEERYPDSNYKVGAVVVPFREQFAGQAQTGIWVLFAASGLVLLIACANIANLLLARASGRNREIAVRAALGADRRTILRQLLTESMLLATLGALLGIACARLAMIILEGLVPASMPGEMLSLDWRMLAFTVVVTTLTGVLFGIFPAFSLGRVDVQHALRQGGRTASGGGRGGLRSALVVSQTALALALLTGAGLMIRTLDHLSTTDLGLRTDHLLTLSTNVPRSRYADHTKQRAFFDSVVRNVRGIPGVLSAGYSSDLPLTAIGNTSGYLIYGQPESTQSQDALFRVVTEDFLQTVGARLREGRFFSASDQPSAARVAIVNETLANRHWPGENVVGKQVQFPGSSGRHWLTIVGVVKEIRERGITLETKPAIYMPLAQSEGYWPVPADLAIRTAVEPASVAGAVRQAVWSVDRDQPISELRTMQEVVDEVLGREEQQTTLLVAFACLALLLAATGVYGVVAYAVSQRRREFGIRLAIGARPLDVLAMVIRQNLGMVFGGVVLGIALSLSGARLLQSILHGVQPNDMATLLIASGALGAVALSACLIAARSAARVDPAVTLREE